ncbi:predicted protein [Histoplasma capsulatum G186AR]|uniref:Uncharacterized protein n=1 Tax=Ajellomyces capsulatus (strain G186AR / H82 / ATCC MYA-2454 / RMSCC 2432) TaxID=447093 RepID=C0NGH0_AJECG|nr:uncharacterized protein HCBG_02442 [Histoplasma capsulatum G186AR]EEH08905.1 predicted protein [Histoplasma capsulatum G186AR]
MLREEETELLSPREQYTPFPGRLMRESLESMVVAPNGFIAWKLRLSPTVWKRLGSLIMRTLDSVASSRLLLLSLRHHHQTFPETLLNFQDFSRKTQESKNPRIQEPKNPRNPPKSTLSLPLQFPDLMPNWQSRSRVHANLARLPSAGKDVLTQRAWSQERCHSLKGRSPLDGQNDDTESDFGAWKQAER